MLNETKTKYLKTEAWRKFSKEVENHIEHYACPQYGDIDSDLISEWSIGQCVDQIKKYASRYGNDVRPDQEKLNLLKIVDYAFRACLKLDVISGENKLVVKKPLTQFIQYLDSIAPLTNDEKSEIVRLAQKFQGRL